MTLLLKNSLTLSVTEVFLSVQGETSYTGLPTTFIRLAGCNLRCVWCDTPYSFVRGGEHSLEALVDMVNANGAPYVCVTGGEPLLQGGIYPLMEELCDRGYRVSLETGGSLSTDRVDPRVKTILDIKCPGSGMADRNLWSNLERLASHDEVKFVVADRGDYEFAKGILEKYELPAKTEHLLVSPAFDQLEPRQLVEWLLEDRLPVRLNLQVHKFIWSPDAKGV